jgi:hypothetical protein
MVPWPKPRVNPKAARLAASLSLKAEVAGTILFA